MDSVNFTPGRSSSVKSSSLWLMSRKDPGVDGVLLGVVIRMEDEKVQDFVCVDWSFLILAGTVSAPTARADGNWLARPKVRREIRGSPGTSEPGR